MELINYTQYPALMFRMILDDNKYAMSVAVKVTYDIADEKVVVSENQEWKLERQLRRSDYGLMDSDDVFKRGGVDILVFGSAKAPKAIPVTSMNVEVKLNSKTINKLIVFGDRFWEKSLMGINISTPKPFIEMPLTLENAFGGIANWDGLSIPHGNNAYGKGYNYTKENIVDKPLPNIENPNNLIHKWTDQPDPVGVACLPQLCELHMRNNVVFDKDGKVIKFSGKFYNTAFPAMILDKAEPGDMIEITGMSAGIFRFIVPYQKILVKINEGEKSRIKQMYIEQIGLIIDKKQAFITYRCPVNYTVTPLEKRMCEILNENN